MMHRTVRAGLGLALIMLLSAGAVSAQNAATTGQIRGRVTDPAGAGVANASVLTRNTQTGLERRVVTSDAGNYAVHLLPPGSYLVRVEMIGFSAQGVPDVTVSIGQAATVNFQLAVQAVTLGAIQVAGERPAVNVASATVVQNVSRKEIESVPVLGRDFVDLINLSGVVAPDPGETTGGQFSIAGQRASQTSVQIDGVDANNSFFGENRGGSRIPFVFSLESIQELQIVTNGFDVEYGNYSGGIVNVVTRGGTNSFRGSAYANYRGDVLTAPGFRDTVKVPEYQVTQYAGSFAGPIIRDKAFFLVSLEGQRRREPQIPIQFTDFDDEPGVQQEIEQFWTALQSVYGIDNPAVGYEPFQTTNDAITLFGRVDWNFNDRHRLSLRHNFSTFTNDREWDENFDFLYGASRAEKIESLSNSFVTELQSVFTPTTFNVFRFQFSNEARPRLGSNLRPALIARLSNGAEIGFGGTFVGFNNELDERKLQVVNNFTHVRGSHTMKVGVNGILTHNRNSFLPAISGNCGRGSQGAGVFCFGSVADFVAGNARSYQFNVREGGGGVPVSEFDVSEVGLYVQDEWRATPRLTVTAGLRHDRQSFGDAPGRIIDVERSFGFPSAIAPTDNNNISPRLSLAWDMDGDGRGVIRAGAGYFFGRVPYVLGGNVLGSERPVFNLTCSGVALRGDATAPPSPLDFRNWSTSGADNPIGCAGAGGFSGVPTYTLWGPDFEYPETFKANIGAERQLGDRAQVALDFIYSRSTNLYTVRNLNLRSAQFQLDNEGGRRVYTPRSLFSPSGGNAPSARVYANLGDIFVNYTDGRAEAFVATTETSYRVSESASLRGSYTYTRSYDNSSYSCCTAGGGFANPRVGAFGPNEVGGFGDDERAWGRSDFGRRHTFLVSGFTTLPLRINLAALWRLQSGRPWGPEVSGDINGDGVSFNDRPFIFSPEDLPLSPTLSAEAAATVRQNYADILADNSCLGDYIGQVIPRNTCEAPWRNQLDVRLTRVFPTMGGQRAELQFDVFNVLNAIGRLNCSDEEMRAAVRTGADLPGWCGWGRFTTVSSSRRNLFTISGFADDQIRYSTNATFGRETVVGSNLQLQFQAQVALRYYF
ncbi:MAG TPA: TonB-dependent receptor [Longimicrobiales bacterium]|nr:TonB-dependent receptor [Longimicrobiales bacterium]